MLPEILASILGGLGLFFIGIKLIAAHLKQSAGRRFRTMIMKAVGQPWRAGLVGAMSGALTQSTNAVTFISMSLITAGALTVPRAIPLVSWANLGTSALVLVATFDLQIFILYLLGLVGAAYYFDIDKSTHWRHIAGALLGIALLFLGLQFIKSGAAPLRDIAAVRDFLSIAAHSYLLVFMVGAAVTMVAQSSSTVSVVAVAMTGIGLFSMSQTMMIIYGAGLGSALSMAFMTANLRGTAKQLAWFQIMLKLVGVMLMTGLFVIELVAGLPLVRAGVEWLVQDVATQAALVYLLFQLLACLAMTALTRPAKALLSRLSPATQAETLAQPRYIYDQALDDAETALDLVEKEQLRLIGHLPDYVPTEGLACEPKALQTLFEANRELARAVGNFLTELMDRHQDRLALQRMINLQGRNALILDLQESLREFALLMNGIGQQGVQDGLAVSLCESLHAIASTLAHAAESADGEDVHLLQMLTSDRTELMDRIRHRLLREDRELPYAVHEALFGATSLFERIIWVLRRFTLLLQTPGEGANPPARDADLDVRPT